jgi:hypothetical protein
MESEYIDKFLNIADDKIKNFLIKVSNKISIPISFISIKKIVRSLYIEGNEEHAKSLFDGIHYYECETDIVKQEKQNASLLEDPEIIKSYMKTKPIFVYINDRKAGNLDSESAFKIWELLDWETDYLDNFQLAEERQQNIKTITKSTPLKYEKKTKKLNAIKKDLSKEFSREIEEKLMVANIFKQDDHRRNIYSVINSQSIQTITRLYGSGITAYITKFKTKAIAKNDITKFKQAELRRYYIYLFKYDNVNNDVAYQMKELHLYKNSIIKILKLSNSHIQMKISKMTLDKLILKILQKPINNLLSFALNKFKTSGIMGNVIKKLPIRRLLLKEDLVNYYVTVYQGMKRIYQAINSRSIKKIQSLLQEKANFENIQTHVKHPFSNANLLALKKYEVRRFGLMLTKFIDTVQYNMKHFYLKSRSISRIIKLYNEEKIGVQYSILSAFKKLNRILGLRIDIIKLNNYFFLWKRKSQKMKRHTKLLREFNILNLTGLKENTDFTIEKYRMDNINFREIKSEKLSEPSSPVNNESEDNKTKINDFKGLVDFAFSVTLNKTSPLSKEILINYQASTLLFNELMKENIENNKKLLKTGFCELNLLSNEKGEKEKCYINNGTTCLSFTEIKRDKTLNEIPCEEKVMEHDIIHTKQTAIISHLKETSLSVDNYHKISNKHKTFDFSKTIINTNFDVKEVERYTEIDHIDKGYSGIKEINDKNIKKAYGTSFAFASLFKTEIFSNENYSNTITSTCFTFNEITADKPLNQQSVYDFIQEDVMSLVDNTILAKEKAEVNKGLKHLRHHTFTNIKKENNEHSIKLGDIKSTYFSFNEVTVDKSFDQSKNINIDDHTMECTFNNMKISNISSKIKKLIVNRLSSKDEDEMIKWFTKYKDYLFQTFSKSNDDIETIKTYLKIVSIYLN